MFLIPPHFKKYRIDRGENYVKIILVKTPIDPSKDLGLFFRQKVKEALALQSLNPSEEVEFYLVHILCRFSKTENLYPANEVGKCEDRALALQLSDAVFAEKTDKKFHHYKTLGDSALYHAGVFYESFYNKVVDVDYYIKMGGLAYHSLANLSTHSLSHMADLFYDLSSGFAQFVEVLNLSCETSEVMSDHDLLKLLDRYQKTKSLKAKKILEDKGIIPEVIHGSVQ